VAGDLTIRSRQKWTSLQNKYRLEDARTNDFINQTIIGQNTPSLCGWIYKDEESQNQNCLQEY
jgi:plasmid maintenance system antidote protein VapI